MRRRTVPTVLVVSLLLHGLIAWRLLPALDWNSLITTMAACGLALSALLVPAPLLVRLAHLPRRASDLLAWTGYLAMGLFSTLFVATLAREVAMLVALLWHALAPASLDLGLWRTLSARVVVSVAAAVSVIGLVNARRTARVVRIDVPLPNLPAALQGFTIVQLSDVHIGPTIQRGFIEAIVGRVNALDADLVAITGDLVDGAVERLQQHIAPLAELKSRHGTFAVTGNHEYYHGVVHWIREWNRLGFEVLDNRSVVLDHGGARLLIGGVSDFSTQRPDDHRDAAVQAARADVAVSAKVLLAHQPRSAPAASAAGFDLQLSGHTHGGQFWPWNLFVPLQQPFVAGLHRLQQLWVYVSRGTGYWGPPLRFGAPSEITCVRLVAAR
ncbi:MAG: metallophosphoesterase [Panacagrimonas sp.]